MNRRRDILVSLILAGTTTLGWSQDSPAQIRAKLTGIRQAIQAAGASWTAGDNPMMHLTDAQKRARVMRPDAASTRKGVTYSLPPVPTDPPGPFRPGGVTGLVRDRPSIDWRDEGGMNFVTPVKDQGECGSCWVFSSIAAMESQWAIKHNVGNPVLDLSEQNVLSCQPGYLYDCWGGMPSDAFTFMQSKGVAPESCLPYSGPYVPCDSLCPASVRRVRKVTGFQNLQGPSLEEMKDAVLHGPVVTGFKVYDDFYDYTGGVYRHVGGDYWGQHAVTIVGYDDDNQCWIVKNSWGTQWGEGGFVRIAYENDADFPLGDIIANVQMNYDWIKVANDFDGNGNSDLLWRNSQTGQVSVQAVNHAIPSAPQVIHTEADPAWKLVGTGDFDGDGHGDLLWWNSTTGQVDQMLMDVDAQGQTVIRSQGVIYTEQDTNWKIVGIADFTADGRSDLLWRHATNGSVFVMPLNGATVLPGSLLYTEPDAAWEIVSTGDRDGDGRADLLWRNSATGQIFQMMIDSSGSSVSIESMDLLYTGMDANWKIVATGDFNGDGCADVIWRCTNGGAIYVMFMRGDTVLPSSDQLTIEPNPDTVIAAVGDYDGDGKSDLLWWNNTTGQVYRMLLDGRTIKSDTLIHTAPSSAWKLLK